jgi:hypothetical protein
MLARIPLPSMLISIKISFPQPLNLCSQGPWILVHYIYIADWVIIFQRIWT